MASGRSTRGKIWGTVIMVLLVMAVSSAYGAQELSGIAPGASVLNAPAKIAVGSDGTIYAVDASKKRIAKFSASGQYLGAISLSGVSAVAVSANGTLYAGSHQNYAVAVIKNGNITGYLGKGPGEFLSIRDIAVDPASDRVYVADSAADEVKIYSASGKSMGAIAPLHLPVGIAVANGKIYVLDKPEIPDPLSATPAATTGTRISVFGSDYVLLATIDDTGDFSMTFRPTDLAVSSSGVIYVSDTGTRSVLLFSSAGTYLGEIRSPAAQFTAVSLALSPDGSLLYVSSRDTHSIHRFSLAEVQ